jgi:hypothetical protein
MADNFGLSDLGPAGWFLESSGSLVAVRVNADGTILAANAQAIALTGLPLVGEPWNAMLLNFAGEEPFRQWLALPARPRLLSVRTTVGLPRPALHRLEERGLHPGRRSRCCGNVRAGSAELNCELSDPARPRPRERDLGHAVRERDALLRDASKVKNLASSPVDG